MRKKSARVLSVLLMICMLFSLVACARPGDNKTQAPDEKDSSGAVTEEREHVELVMYNYKNANTTGLDETLEAINKYLKEKLNTTIEFHFYEQSEYNNSVSTIFNSGTYMDILISGASRVNFNLNASKNAFLPLEDYVDEYLPVTKSYLPDEAFDAFTVNGHLYAVPTTRDLASRFTFVANQTLIDDLGITVPEFGSCLDAIQFLYDAKAARDAKYPEKAKQPIIGGLLDMMQAYYFFEPILGNNLLVANIPGLLNFEGMGEGETVFCPYYTDEYREYVKLRYQLVKDNIIPFDATTFDPDKVLLNNGELLGGFSLGEFFVDEDVNAPYYKTKLYTSEIAVTTMNFLQEGGFAISAKSKYPERALEVIELLNSDSYLATLFRFGPEGVGWTDKDGDNVVELTDLNADPANRYYYVWNPWRFGGYHISKTPPGVPANYWEIVDGVNKSAVAGTNIGFIFDQTAVQNEIAACNNVYAEFYKTLSSGQNDNYDELVDNFIAKLKANGMDKIIEEAQNQLTTWRAANGLKTK